MEQALQALQEHVIGASQVGTPLRLRGGGSKDWYGQALNGEVLDTRDYRGIVAYDPTELVITVRCGTPLMEIENALSEHAQMLACEPPHFGAGATVGGMVAAGLSGPRRQAAGAVRDFLLGAVLMNGKGEILHFGGQVMKNVAGYDISRLLAGSLGTLGLILEVSLKVLPKPFAEVSLQFELNQDAAIRCMNEWAAQALPISATVWQDDCLTLRLSGSDAALKAAHQRMGGDYIEADRFWEDVREQRLPFFVEDGNALWRLSVPSTTATLALPGTQLIEWGGAQRWLASDADSAVICAVIRTVTANAGGHATLFRGGDKAVGVFHPLAPSLAAIQRRLKQAFDPTGIFNPGRMYG